MATFTRYPYTVGDPQITPIDVEAPWVARRTTRTIAHDLLEDAHTVYTLLPPRPRQGTMVLHFDTSAEAHAAETFFSSPAEYDMYPVDPPELSARFVVIGGDLEVAQFGDHWTVTVPWMEVS